MGKSPDAFRTISEVAEWLETQAHVLRFWESKFTQVKPVKRAGGRRYYRPADMLLLGGLKKILHEDGMTIKGAQKLLREKGIKHVAAMSQPLGEDFSPEEVADLANTIKALNSPSEAPAEASEAVAEAPAPAVADTSSEDDGQMPLFPGFLDDIDHGNRTPMGESASREDDVPTQAMESYQQLAQAQQIADAPAGEAETPPAPIIEAAEEVHDAPVAEEQTADAVAEAMDAQDAGGEDLHTGGVEASEEEERPTATTTVASSPLEDFGAGGTARAEEDPMDVREEPVAPTPDTVDAPTAEEDTPPAQAVEIEGNSNAIEDAPTQGIEALSNAIDTSEVAVPDAEITPPAASDDPAPDAPRAQDIELPEDPEDEGDTAPAPSILHDVLSVNHIAPATHTEAQALIARLQNHAKRMKNSA